MRAFAAVATPLFGWLSLGVPAASAELRYMMTQRGFFHDFAPEETPKMIAAGVRTNACMISADYLIPPTWLEFVGQGVEEIREQLIHHAEQRGWEMVPDPDRPDTLICTEPGIFVLDMEAYVTNNNNPMIHVDPAYAHELLDENGQITPMFEDLIFAINNRIKAAKRFYVNGKVGVFNTVRPHPRGLNMDARMNGYMKARELGMFEKVDILVPNIYIRFGPCDYLNNVHLYNSNDNMVIQGINKSREITRLNGEAIPLLPLTRMVVHDHPNTCHGKHLLPAGMVQWQARLLRGLGVTQWAYWEGDGYFDGRIDEVWTDCPCSNPGLDPPLVHMSPSFTFAYSFLQGDIDGSGCVDQADINAVVAQLGMSSALGLEGDIDQDDDVDDQDLALILNLFMAPDHCVPDQPSGPGYPQQWPIPK